MLIGSRGNNSSPRCPVQKTTLNQIRFVEFFNCSFVFRSRSCNRTNANRSTTKLLNDRREDFAVKLVQTVHVDFHSIERFVRERLGDATIPDDLRKITNATNKHVRDSRRASCPPGNLCHRSVFDLDCEDLSRAFKYLFQFALRIEIEMMQNAEPAAQWGGYQTCSCRRSD